MRIDDNNFRIYLARLSVLILISWSLWTSVIEWNVKRTVSKVLYHAIEISFSILNDFITYFSRKVNGI